MPSRLLRRLFTSVRNYGSGSRVRVASRTRRAFFESLEERSLLAGFTDPAGGNQAHANLQPYTTLTYVIAVEGVFPTQNLSAGNERIGSVEMFAGNFAPRGYLPAAGQELPIAEYEALFAVIQNTYGGDGVETFALPDLRGRVPVGVGQGPGTSSYVLGQSSGSDNDVTLGASNLASHTHTVPNSVDPTGATGAGQAFENRQPTLALTPVINLQGIFPSRDLSGTVDLLGSVSWFAGNFAPKFYALANGQLLSIALNTALFSVLGTTYGGNGTTTFALPDLRGRMAIGTGSGAGLQSVLLGQTGGSEMVTPTVTNLPAHAHSIPGSPNPTGVTGGNQPFDNRQPFLGLNYDIALAGAFPTRPLGAGDPTGDPTGNPVGQGFVSGDAILDESTARPLIDSLVQEAIGLWQAAGIDETQIAKLAAVRVEIGDLAAGGLASAGESVITLDRDASNRGWFIDVTPGDNVEFGLVDPVTGELAATDPQAAHHYDLLTAIVHEQGHILGLNHTPLPGSIMYGGLTVGARNLPEASDLVQSGLAPEEEQFLEGLDPILASVGMFAGNFPPRFWAETRGQMVTISSNTALFSILGTTYGGNGITHFALPNTQGRAVLGSGQGPGLSDYALGQIGGLDAMTLSVNQIPSHTHQMPAPPAIPDVSVTKTDTVATATPGGTVTYTIVVSNSGSVTATGTTLTDNFPAAITNATWTSVAAGGATGNTLSSSGNISQTLALPTGSSVTYTVIATIAASATGSLVNTATVAHASDTTPGNNSAMDTDTLTPRADLQTNKTGPAFATAGTDVAYTITFTNAGPSDAQIPIFGDSVTSGNGSSVTFTQTGGATSLAVFAAGTTRTYQAVLHVNANAVVGSLFTDVATTSSSTSDPIPANNSFTFSSTVASAGTLSATLASGALTVADIDPTGKNNDFTISVVGSDLVITDANEQFISAPTTTPPSSLTNGGKTLTVPLSSLAAGLTVNGNGGSDMFVVAASLGSLSALALNGGDGNDTFGSATQKIVPSTVTAIAIVGGGPLAPARPVTSPPTPTGDAPGDVVNIDFSARPLDFYLVLGTPALPAGNVATKLFVHASAGVKPFSYQEIEDLNLYDGASRRSPRPPIFTSAAPRPPLPLART